MPLLMQEIRPSERPRERFLSCGAGGLREAELLAILLRTGYKGCSAVSLAEELLKKFGGLDGLSRMDVGEIARMKGVGLAKAIQVKSAFELGSRLSRQRVESEKMDEPARIYALVGDEMAMLPYESARVILLNTRLHLISVEEISRGVLNQTVVHPREVFAHALARRAYGVLLVHNHPSGDPAPSEADLRLTKAIQEAARLMETPLVDHIIIGRKSAAHPQGWFSFKSAGYL